MPVFQSEVSRIQDLTHDVRELDLSLLAPDSIEFKAGQWISLDVWHPKLKQHVQRQVFDCFATKPVPTNHPYSSIECPTAQAPTICLVFKRGIR